MGRVILVWSKRFHIHHPLAPQIQQVFAFWVFISKGQI
jgi:hypothetical protein